MGADVKGEILSIMTEIVTLKALSEDRCGLVTDRDVDDPSGGGEDQCSIRERLKKGPVES